MMLMMLLSLSYDLHLIEEHMKEYSLGVGLISPPLFCYFSTSQAYATLGMVIIPILQRGKPRHRESKGKI